MLISKPIDPHMYAALCGVDAALDLVESMPDVDLPIEISAILTVLHEIMMHIIQDQHFGDKALNQYIAHCKAVCDAVNQIKPTP